MRYPIEILTKHEVQALLEACGQERWTDRRNYTLIVLLYRTGLRISEALALRPCDVDLDRGAIRVLRGKGGRARSVGVDRWGADALGKWLAEHAAMGRTKGDVVFFTASGRPLPQSYLRRRLPELARAAGVYKRTHAHGLRHTHAAELRSESMDIALIQRQLGHRSLLTTILYVQHLVTDSLIETINQREP